MKVNYKEIEIFLEKLVKENKKGYSELLEIQLFEDVFVEFNIDWEEIDREKFNKIFDKQMKKIKKGEIK